MPTTPGPVDDAGIPAYLQALGIPGLADIHVHFLPEPMLRKVWAYFDAAEENYGRPWPIQYRFDEATRLRIVRSFGVSPIPALTYPHRPGMARWLNDWSADLARRVPDVIHCATLYPEPDVGDYVGDALTQGARLFKVHVQVGRFAPDDPLLDPAWALLEEAGVPIVIHAGSAPLPGEFTGVEGIARVLRRYPRLVFVIAHLGMPEYDEFADLALQYERVHLDTTMAVTDFTEEQAPTSPSYRSRLPQLQDKIVLGSDFPNIPYPYAHQLTALTRLDLGDDWMRDVLWHNGARLLGGS
ncbi:amidohydrolase family protein [Allobranchiibius sp. GilTou38]|uniref:amidohydrolase family protein n=1 Tax=Allobranchiibius sp. GilTou38 TaxID=2815210 RepID=UPI001AA13028|nr:amidohydrolase family protein [Allobranchiibius sp. GilTou38]MBO1768428.1 amidohydrolase [Allobranchiibius sp. GilTou38]